MSLKRPSYFFRIVFLVLRYKGQPLDRAIWKELCAKSSIDLSWLYMPMATPPPSVERKPPRKEQRKVRVVLSVAGLKRRTIPKDQSLSGHDWASTAKFPVNFQPEQAGYGTGTEGKHWCWIRMF